MNVLIVIPARQGSRRLPDKNILDLGGKPLIAWTIEAAERAAELLRYDKTQIIVSTDSSKYAEIAGDFYYKIRTERLGAKAYPSKEAAMLDICPFIRPPEISGDCDTGLVVKHAWEYAETFDFSVDVVVTLQPTSPFRDPDDIVACVRALKEHHTSGETDYLWDCVFTAKKATEFPHWMFRMGHIAQTAVDAESYLGVPLKYLSGIIAQDLPPLYLPTGSIYAVKSEVVAQGRVYGDKPGMIIVGGLKKNIDIETMDDLLLARTILKMEEEQKNAL